LIANRPSSAAVKYTYGPRIKAIFDKWYGLVHNTEQRAAAIVTTERLVYGHPGRARSTAGMSQIVAMPSA